MRQLQQAADDTENVQNERLDELRESHSKELDKERSRWIQHKRSFMVEAESLRADIVVLKRQARSFKDIEDELQSKVKLAEKSSEDTRAQLEKQVRDASDAACAELDARHKEEMRKLHEQYRQDITALQTRLLNQGEERDMAAKSFEMQLRAAREEMVKVSDEQKNIEELLAAEKKQRGVDQKEHELRVAGIRQQHQENILLAKSQLQTEHEEGIGVLSCHCSCGLTHYTIPSESIIFRHCSGSTRRIWMTVIPLSVKNGSTFAFNLRNKSMSF